MKPFLNLIWSAFQALVMKCISFKHVVFAVATYIGIKVLFKVIAIAPDNTDVVSLFKIWVLYEGGLLVLFYASNQIQKWIFTKALPKESEPENEG